MTTRYLLTTALSLLMTLSFVSTASAAGDNEFTVSGGEKIEKGKVLDSGDDYIKVAFPGLAGYKVIYTGRHNRSWIDLEYEGKTTDFFQALGEACPGIMSNKANDVVQWRGVRSKDAFKPYAVIVRLSSTVLDEKSTTDRLAETLVVIKLDGASSKVVGSVASNKGGNEAAEALADKLCGPK